jgi:hypothetical protein
MRGEDEDGAEAERQGMRMNGMKRKRKKTILC